MKKDKPIQYEVYRKGDNLLSYLFLFRGVYEKAVFIKFVAKIRKPIVV